MSEYDVLNTKSNTTSEAEKSVRDTKSHQEWLENAEMLREVITLFRKEKIHKRQDIGYLQALLLEVKVSELESAVKKLIAQDVATGSAVQEEKKDDTSFTKHINRLFGKIKSTVNEMSSYGVNTEIKYPDMPTQMQKKHGNKTKEKKSAAPLGLLEANVMGEIFANIVDISEYKDTQYPGAREQKDILTAELKATGKAGFVLGKISGKYTRRADDLTKSEKGDRYKAAGLGIPLLGIDASAEVQAGLWAASELMVLFDNVGDINLSEKQQLKKTKKEVAEAWIAAGKSEELKKVKYFLTPEEEKEKRADDARAKIAKEHNLNNNDLINITIPDADADVSLMKGLVQLRVAGRTGVTARGKASAGVKISAFPEGFTSKPKEKSDDPPLSDYALSANVGVEGFAGAKTEGNAGFSFLSSKFGTYGLSTNVKGVVSAGLGGSARAELGVGAQGVKFHTSLGATLGVGTEVGVDVGINALAAMSAVKEKLAPLVSKVSKSRGEKWRADSMQYGTKQKMLDLYDQLTSSIETLSSRLDKLQPVEHTRSAIAKTVDNAFANTGQGFQTAASERAMKFFQEIALTARNIMSPESLPEPLAEQPESEDGREDTSRSEYEIRGMAILAQEIEKLRQEINEQRREFFKELYNNQP
ncbi:hypothetical protein [Serratia proteamaculans]